MRRARTSIGLLALVLLGSDGDDEIGEIRKSQTRLDLIVVVDDSPRCATTCRRWGFNVEPHRGVSNIGRHIPRMARPMDARN
ncbi:MAG: hypothetical protein HC927_03180 [Deltaproteobacteria bacterium]|nr:hypothetical protein [Deltaproteobacteria bacterium]